MPDISKIKETLKEKVVQTTTIEYNYDFLKKNWDEFCAVKKSKGLTDEFIALSNAKIEISKENENVIIVEFDNKEYLKNFKIFEKEFLQQLKLKIRKQEIEFKVTYLDRSSEKPKIFTDEDRFNYIASKNPKLNDLKSTLGLDFEY